jgi:pimeloyl-ACP methyl ester carboxylesterase
MRDEARPTMNRKPSGRGWRRPLGFIALSVLLCGGFFVACVSFGPPSTARAFAGRPEPREHRLARNGAGTLAFAETGADDAPLVLFVHGSPGSWRDFAFVMANAELAERARLVSVDRLGWGGSAECGLVSALAEQATALAEILRQYPANLPAVVVGHSLGGPVAARLALDHPELVRALVLVASSIDPELEETTWYQALGRTRIVRSILPAVLARADDEIRPLRGELELLVPRWSELRRAVFVLHGESDALVPVANADFAARVITNAPLSIERRRGQGHLIPWQQPAWIASTILRALRERPQ